MEPPGWLTLDPDEEIVWADEPRTRRVVSTIATAVFWSAVVVGLAYLLVNVVPEYLGRGYPFPTAYFWTVAWVLVIAWAVVVLLTIGKTATTDYVLTDRNIYRKHGLLSKTMTRVGVDRVRNTTIHKGMFGNLLDYGSVEIDTGGHGSDLELTGLADPEAFRQELRGVERDARGSGAGDGPGDGAVASSDSGSPDRSPGVDDAGAD